MAVIGGFRSDLSIKRNLETFPRVFVFPIRVSTKTVVKFMPRVSERERAIRQFVAVFSLPLVVTVFVSSVM